MRMIQYLRGLGTRRLLLPFLICTLLVTGWRGPRGAEAASFIPVALSSISPLTNSAMSLVAGTGLGQRNIVGGNGGGGVILWDEMARSPRPADKTGPGVSIIINNIPQ